MEAMWGYPQLGLRGEPAPAGYGMGRACELHLGMTFVQDHADTAHGLIWPLKTAMMQLLM